VRLWNQVNFASGACKIDSSGQASAKPSYTRGYAPKGPAYPGTPSGDPSPVVRGEDANREGLVHGAHQEAQKLSSNNLPPNVVTRTREIGIRMALGASGARVLRQVIGESAVLTMIGIGAGVPVALWISRGAAALLYGVRPADPWTYAVLAIALAGIALSASWIPARRAARVDPVVALRYE